MPIGDPYATLVEFKTRLGVGDTNDDDALTSALQAASRHVEAFCRRQFNKEIVASARSTRPIAAREVHVDDFYIITDLVVATDENDDGTFETTWSATDYQVEPIVRHGVTDWPFWRIRAVGSRTFPPGKRDTVQTTARWGWNAVPDEVKEATLVLAEDVFKLKDTPFGVGGFGEFGRIRARENPHVMLLLGPYRRGKVRVGA